MSKLNCAFVFVKDGGAGEAAEAGAVAAGVAGPPADGGGDLEGDVRKRGRQTLQAQAGSQVCHNVSTT